MDQGIGRRIKVLSAFFKFGIHKVDIAVSVPIAVSFRDEAFAQRLQAMQACNCSQYARKQACNKTYHHHIHSPFYRSYNSIFKIV